MLCIFLDPIYEVGRNSCLRSDTSTGFRFEQLLVLSKQCSKWQQKELEVAPSGVTVYVKPGHLFAGVMTSGFYVLSRGFGKIVLLTMTHICDMARSLSAFSISLEACPQTEALFQIFGCEGNTFVRS